MNKRSSGYRNLFASTILIYGLVSTACYAEADPLAPPIHQAVDANGVDMLSGKFVINAAQFSVGAGAGQMAYRRYLGGNGFREAAVPTLNGNINHITATVGTSSETFSLNSSSVYVSDQHMGGSLVRDNSLGYYTYTDRHGTIVHFSNPPGPRPIFSSFGQVYDQKNPDGSHIRYNFENVTISGYVYFRLQSITNTYGYEIKYEYATDTLDFSSPSQGLDFWSITKVTGFSNALETCDRLADHCSLSSAWPYVAFSRTSGSQGGDWGTGTETVTDARGNGTAYTFTDGLLTSVRLPGSTSDDMTISYLSGKVSSVVHGGSSYSYTWTDSGAVRTASMTGPLGAARTVVSDTTNNLVTSDTDALSHTVSYSYDSYGRTKSITSPETNRVEYLYDDRGNISSVTSYPKNSSTGTVVSTFSFPSSCDNYLTCNKPTWSKDFFGNQTDYAYDSGHGGVTSVTLPAGASGIRPETRYQYTPVTSTYSTYAGYNGFTSSTMYLASGTTACQTVAAASCPGTSDEAKTVIVYNVASANFTAASTSAGSSTTTLTSGSVTYDNIGNIVSTTDPLGNVSYAFYDANRQLLGTISPDPDGAGSLLRRTTRYTYSATGQVTKIEQGTATGTALTDLTGMAVLRVTDIGYDSSWRQIRSSSTAGGTLYSVTQYSYDALSRPDCTALRMNPPAYSSLPSSACMQGTAGAFGQDHISKNGYDAAGRLTSVTTGYGATGNGGASLARAELTYAYTANGKIQSVTDAGGNKTGYVYDDDFDRLTKTYYPDPSSPGNTSATDYEQLTYDAPARLFSRRLRDGQTITYGYDSLKQVTSQSFSSGDPTRSYAYDLLGRPTTITRATNAVSFTYDALGRTTLEAQPFGSAASEYDAAHRTKLTWNDGYYVSYKYDSLGEMTKIQENGATSGVGVLAQFSYDNLGQRTFLSRGNGTATAYGYDYGAAPRFACIRHDLAGGNASPTCGTTPTATAQDWSVNFGYNPASQITTRISANDQYAWTQSYNVSRSYTPNGLNQYAAISTLPSAPSYDARGNLTSTGGTTYVYNSENMLVSATGATSATLYYDATNRLAEYDTSVSTRFLYDGSDMIAEIENGSGAVLQRYVHGPGDDEPLVWYQGAGTSDRRWLHADERGSVIAVSDGSGNAMAANSYDAWGIPQTTNLGRFQYTGQAWLPELGLYNYKARIYSATLGRFLQTDPAGYGDGLNWYNYAGGDPVNATDPSGLANGPPMPARGTNPADCPAYLSCLSISSSISKRSNNSSTSSEPSGPFGGSPGPSVLSSLAAYVANSPALMAGAVMARFNGKPPAPTPQNSGCGSHPILGALGKLNALPLTAVGSLIGAAGYVDGLFNGSNPSVALGNNAIQFRNVPFVSAGFTLGNAAVYGSEHPGNTGMYPSYTGNVDLGRHEEGHTVQSQILGPLGYAAVHLWNGIGKATNPLERGADDYARGTSCTGF